MSMKMSEKHPNGERLALFAGGDLDFLDRMRTSFHVRGCGQCQKTVASHQVLRTALPKLELPPEIAEGISNWDRLSEEMTANIRLGLSAAECIGPSKLQQKSRFALAPLRAKAFLPAFAGVAVCLLTAAAFFLNAPHEQQRSLARAWDAITHGGVARGERGVVLEATQAGLEMKQDGRSLISVRHPEQRNVASMSASLEGSVRAGYVDDETGQVTFTNVYSGQ